MAAAKAPAEELATVKVEDRLESDTMPEQELASSRDDLQREERHSSALPPPTSSRRGSSAFLGFVTGGILAAGVGLGLARYLANDWPFGSGANDLVATLSAQSQEIADLSAKVAELASRPTLDETAIAPLISQTIDEKLASLPAQTDSTSAMLVLEKELDSKLGELDLRLANVEKMPTTGGLAVSTTALTAYDRELRALKDQVSALSAGGPGTGTDVQVLADEVKAQMASISDELGKMEAGAAASVAFGRIQSALDVGGPYAEALGAIAASGVEIPAALSASAETGVKSLTELQRSFPGYARTALDASRRANMGESWTERFTSFFKVQTGVRSLEPKEGSDTDAILSRAEAALNDGQLGDTIKELAQLSDTAKSSMAEWAADAQARLSATEAFSALAVAMDKG
jgi:hypothetical protein